MAFAAWRTWVAGAVVTAAQLNQDIRDNLNAWFPLAATAGTAWTAYTPTLTQSATVTKTTNLGRYTQIGKTVTGTFAMTVTGAGTAGNTVTPGLPVTAAWSGLTDPIGIGYVYDSSAAIKYRGLLLPASTIVGQYLTMHSTTDGLLGLVDFTAALAVNDLVVAHFTYEAA